MKGHFLCVALLCVAASLCHAEERWALLVGVNQYADHVIVPLRGAVNDTQALKNVLIEDAGFAPRNVFCLTSNDKANLPDLRNIVSKLKYVSSEMKPGDVFLFFFSGHGMSYNGASYLLAYESHIDPPELLPKTGLSSEELMGYLGKIKSGKVILILDACRNSPRSGKGDEDNLMSDEFARSLRILPREPGRPEDMELQATIYVCKIRQRAYEHPRKERGIFSIALEEALSGLADNGDGVFLASEKWFSRKDREMFH